MTLLLASHKGSLEHCYHFWMGYFLPSCEWLIDSQNNKTIKMVECGPMTHWIEHLQKFKNIKIIKPRTALNFYLENIESKVFYKLDDFDNISSVSYLSKIDDIKSIFFPRKKDYDIDIVIVDRRPSLPFYSSPQCETPTAGADRKKIANIGDIKRIFEPLGKTVIIDPTDLSAQETVDIFSNVKYIVGQFGAGLTNMIWMKPGTTCIEIRPVNTGFNEDDVAYKEISKRLNINHLVIYAQTDWFSNVDLNKIKEVVDSL